MELTDVIKKLEKCKGFQLGVTFLDDKGMLEHVLLTEKFPMSDMLKSHEKIKKLVIDELENDQPQDSEFTKTA